jgi:DNA-3-methyladenine glycosylase II
MTDTLILKGFPPFNFDLSVAIFSNGDKQIRKYQDGKFWQIIRVDGRLVLVTVKALGTVDHPKLSVELRSDHTISKSDRKKAGKIGSALLNLDFDLKPFYEHAKNDETLIDVIQRLRGLKIPTTPTVFEALIDSIVEQQISLTVAHVLETKLVKTFGQTLKLNDEVYYAYPTAQELASASFEQLRGCGLSLRKAEYIKGVSKMITSGKLHLEGFKDCSDVRKIISELDRIRGIGIWTAELTIVRGMQKHEVIPADDLGLRRVISHYYFGDRKISGQEARRIADKWGKWKGLAAFYLIMAEAMETIDK